MPAGYNQVVLSEINPFTVTPFILFHLE